MGVLLCCRLLLGIWRWGLLMRRLGWLLRVRRLRCLELRWLGLRLLWIGRLGMRSLRWWGLGIGRLLWMRTLLVVIWTLALLAIPAGTLLTIRRNLLCIREAAHRALRPALHGHGVPLRSLGSIWLSWVSMSLLWS